jgi:hypothetical protein
MLMTGRLEHCQNPDARILIGLPTSLPTYLPRALSRTRPGNTRQRGNAATRQRGNAATRQRGNAATRQRGNAATRQRGNAKGHGPQRGGASAVVTTTLNERRGVDKKKYATQ